MTTIDEVALKSGVGRGTVSRVINDDPRVHPLTRSRVLSIIEELDYHPNSSARRMVRKAIDTIGIATLGIFKRPWEDNLFYAPMLGGINDIAADHGCHMLWFIGLYSDPPKSTAPLFDRRCDGIVLLSVPEFHPSIAKLLRMGIPFVMASDTADNPRISSVDVENLESARVMTNYLLGRGHRKIAFVGQVSHYRWVQDRLQGYSDALADHGIEQSRVVFLQESYSDPYVMDKIVDLMRLPPESRPTALFVTTENLAFDAVCALRNAGFRVPEDVSIVSFGNPDDRILRELSLTSMGVPTEEIGKESVILLMDIIAGRAEQGKKITLPAKFNARGSVVTRA
jgi:LacI family transcriptional regulator